MLWLFSQALSFCALPAVDWISPAPVDAKAKDCFETAASEQCPMRDADGQPCPMHQGAGSTNPVSERACSMRALTGGPSAMLAGLFSLPGVMFTSSAVLPVRTATTITVSSANLLGLALPLDSPPPRS